MGLSKVRGNWINVSPSELMDHLTRLVGAHQQTDTQLRQQLGYLWRMSAAEGWQVTLHDSQYRDWVFA